MHLRKFVASVVLALPLAFSGLGSAPASAMPIDTAPATLARGSAPAGVEAVRWVCGPYGCVWRRHWWGYRPYWHRHYWHRPFYGYRGWHRGYGFHHGYGGFHRGFGFRHGGFHHGGFGHGGFHHGGFRHGGFHHR